MPKFKESKVTGLLGITTIFQECGSDGVTPTEDGFQIRADKLGLQFQGNSRHLSDMEALNDLAQTIDRAWRLHMAYRPKITNAAGH